MQEAEFIWFQGELVPWHAARIHVLSHVVHYGSGIFEGLRAYPRPDGAAVLALGAHVARLFQSARILGFELPFETERLEKAVAEVLRANRLRSAYVRPFAFRGYGTIGVDPKDAPVQVAVAAFPWGALHGPEGLAHGIDVCVSSWRRMAPDTHPAMAKASANYLNSQLVLQEAKRNGYHEGLVLDVGGFLSEGSGENLFLVQGGELWTPSISSSILAGITRGIVIALARELGYAVREERMVREQLYTAEEIFLTGTAAEITPVRSVDRRPVGASAPGPVTARLQKAYFDVLHGRAEDRFGWLTHVAVPGS